MVVVLDLGSLSKMLTLLALVIMVLTLVTLPVPAWAQQPCTKPVDIPTYQALYSLYNATGGYNWTYSNSSSFVHKWNFTSVDDDSEGAARPCRDDWAGVTCTSSVRSDSECNIFILNVSNFGLKGSLPGGIANITAIGDMYLNNNFLSGTLPTYLGLMTSITIISISTNFIVGDIPSEFGQLLSLFSLGLDSNFLSGAVPTELAALSLLGLLDLTDNYLTGPIDQFAGRFFHLFDISVANNMLTGSVLSLLSSQTAKLTTLDVSFNMLTGTLSSEIGDLVDLTVFSVGVNALSGSFPPSMGLLSHLRSLSADINFLDGSIPPEVAYLNLSTLYVSINSISGPLPSELGRLTNLVNLDVSENRITGPIPSELGNLVNLLAVYLDFNSMTGPLPSGLCSLPRLLQLGAPGNYLTSNLPVEVSTLSALGVLAVDANYMTGTMVSTLSSNLINLEISLNYFTGSLTYLFGADASERFPLLLMADVSTNGFSGSFPSSLFSLRNLQVFSAASNCFRGRLVCDSAEMSSLRMLDLSALSSGVFCRDYIIPQSVFSDTGYYPINYMEGSIPSCFWNFEKLVTLYLDGNGFTGSIESSTASLGPNFINISLASNQLTGTIADFITSHNWTTLELSSNRLHGQVSGLDLCSATNFIDVSVNRLSGSLTLTSDCDWGNLSSNVLEGNLFTYPVYDLSSVTFIEAMTFYGSYTLDIAMICSAPVLLLGAGMWVRTLVRGHTKTSIGGNMLGYSDNGWRYMLALALALIAYNFLLYPIMKLRASNAATHANQYSWLISAAYLHGEVAAFLIIVPLTAWLSIFSPWVYATIVQARNCMHNSADIACVVSVDDGIENSPLITGQTVITSACAVGGLYLVNLIVIGAANTGYLIAVVDNNPFIQLIQVALSAFKLSWNVLFVKSSMKFLKNSSAARLINPLIFRCTIKLVNFVLVPCVATVLVSDSCFLKLFQQQPAPFLDDPRCDSTDVLYKNDTLRCSAASDYNVGALDPPFIYSYQCSSAVITNYVPVLLYAYAITGFAVPSYIVILISASDDGKGLFSRIVRRLKTWGPRILRRSTESTNPWMLFPFEPLVGTIILSSTILCTFGLAFPYLAAVILCGLVLEVWAWLVAIGKHLHLCDTSRRNKSVFDELVKRVTSAHLMLTVTVTFAFWAGILFDMIADVYGLYRGLITLLVILFTGPVIVFLSVMFSPALTRIFLSIASTAENQAPGDKQRLVSSASAIDERFSLTKGGFMTAPLLLNSEFRDEKL
jgi:Leucine-rich repeat (LRR) protein